MRRLRRWISIEDSRKRRGRGVNRAPQFLPQSRFRPGGCSRGSALRSTTAAGATAGIAFEAGSVADQGEVAALAATVALVTFHTRCLDLLHTRVSLDHLDGNKLFGHRDIAARPRDDSRLSRCNGCGLPAVNDS